MCCKNLIIFSAFVHHQKWWRAGAWRQQCFTILTLMYIIFSIFGENNMQHYDKHAFKQGEQTQNWDTCLQRSSSLTKLPYSEKYIDVKIVNTRGEQIVTNVPAAVLCSGRQFNIVNAGLQHVIGTNIIYTFPHLRHIYHRALTMIFVREEPERDLHWTCCNICITHQNKEKNPKIKSGFCYFCWSCDIVWHKQDNFV